MKRLVCTGLLTSIVLAVSCGVEKKDKKKVQVKEDSQFCSQELVASKKSIEEAFAKFEKATDEEKAKQKPDLQADIKKFSESYKEIVCKVEVVKEVEKEGKKESVKELAEISVDDLVAQFTMKFNPPCEEDFLKELNALKANEKALDHKDDEKVGAFRLELTAFETLYSDVVCNEKSDKGALKEINVKALLAESAKKLPAKN